MKAVPPQNPPTAGRKASRPRWALCSIAGIKRLQTDAATMTPAAKPVSARCSPSDICSFIKKTQAAPRVVPINGIINP